MTTYPIIRHCDDCGCDLSIYSLGDYKVAIGSNGSTLCGNCFGERAGIAPFTIEYEASPADWIVDEPENVEEEVEELLEEIEVMAQLSLWGRGVA